MLASAPCPMAMFVGMVPPPSPTVEDKLDGGAPTVEDKLDGEAGALDVAFAACWRLTGTLESCDRTNSGQPSIKARVSTAVSAFQRMGKWPIVCPQSYGLIMPPCTVARHVPKGHILRIPDQGRLIWFLGIFKNIPLNGLGFLKLPWDSYLHS